MSIKNDFLLSAIDQSIIPTVLQFLDCMEDEILIISKEGSVLYANKSALNRSGQKNNAGKPERESQSKIEKLQYKSLYEQVLSSGAPQFQKFKKNDQWYKTTFSPIFDEEGKISCIGLLTQNITEQVRNEELLKKTLLEVATAQEDERHRISRDLHDEIGQRMTALLFQLRTLNEIVKNEKNIEPEEIESASQNLDIIIKHLRQIFFQLYPPSLNRVSLSKVLDALCSSIKDTYKLEIDLSYQDNLPDLVDHQAITVYRFVQEGLTNIVKHARATSAWINLDYSDGELNISIEDDGCGFSVQTMKEGVGLRGLRERFLMLNGNFEIETSPNKGTRLSGSIPITS